MIPLKWHVRQAHRRIGMSPRARIAASEKGDGKSGLELPGHSSAHVAAGGGDGGGGKRGGDVGGGDGGGGDGGGEGGVRVIPRTAS